MIKWMRKFSAEIDMWYNTQQWFSSRLYYSRNEELWKRKQLKPFNWETFLSTFQSDKLICNTTEAKLYYTWWWIRLCSRVWFQHVASYLFVSLVRSYCHSSHFTSGTSVMPCWLYVSHLIWLWTWECKSTANVSRISDLGFIVLLVFHALLVLAHGWEDSRKMMHCCFFNYSPECVVVCGVGW